MIHLYRIGLLWANGAVAKLIYTGLIAQNAPGELRLTVAAAAIGIIGALLAIATRPEQAAPPDPPRPDYTPPIATGLPPRSTMYRPADPPPHDSRFNAD